MIKRFLCLAMLSSTWTTAQARPWTDASGRTIEVAQWRVDGETVFFLINGKEVPEPMAKLSAPDQSFARQWAVDHPPKPAAEPKKEPEAPASGGKVEKLPNGDVIIQNLPSLALEEEVRNYIPITVILTLEKLYQWPTDLLKLAKDTGWQPRNDTWDQREYYVAAGKEGHAKVLSADKFDFEDAIRFVNKGRPLIVWRGWRQERDDTLVAFAKQLQTDPEAKLPSPRDAAERKKWQTDHSGSSAITSMVIGYNRQRGEVMLYIPNWGADYACFRMRKEEMEASVYTVWYYEPK